jgi:hypothetical protein
MQVDESQNQIGYGCSLDVPCSLRACVGEIRACIAAVAKGARQTCPDCGRSVSYSRMNGVCPIFVGYTASAKDLARYGLSLRECNIDHLIRAVQ